MSKLSPMQQSLAHLRSQGYLCAIVERRVAGGKVHITQDLFGFADILGVAPNAGLLLKSGDSLTELRGFMFVQTTSYGNVSARIKKIEASPEAKRVLAAGGRIFVHGWDRNRFREVEVTL